MNKKLWFVVTIVVWIAFIGVTGLIYHVNHYLPKGPSYSTGEYICQNDDRGPCKEEFKEDLRGLDIPDWAKFFKQSGGELLWMGLLFAGIAISSRNEKI